MSRIDVRDLKNESLPQDAFPADPKADFRFFMAPEVRRGIEEHAKKDSTVEICGVLVGRWGQDAQGPFAAATNYIRCETAASKFAEVTFTHESWAQINKEMDSKYDDQRIVGWYHSHPDFGIFLSDRDCFIQEHFFSGPGQVAYVIDPVRDDEGVFAWHAGKPKLLPHFWIGNAIRATDPNGTPPGRSAMPMHATPTSATTTAASSPQYDPSWIAALTTVLSWVAIFLLGALYSWWWLGRQQGEIARGAAARIVQYADLNVLKVDMEKDLADLQHHLVLIGDELKKVPPPGAELKPDEIKAAAKQRNLIAEHLRQCEREISQIAQEYGLSQVEQQALATALLVKQEEWKLALEDARRKGAESAKKVQTKKPDDKKPTEETKKPVPTEEKPMD